MKIVPQAGVVTVYTTNYCPYCTRAKALLDQLGVVYELVDVTESPDMRQMLVELTGGRTTVPQIFVGSGHIGGYDDLAALHAQNEFLPLVENNKVS